MKFFKLPAVLISAALVLVLSTTSYAQVLSTSTSDDSEVVADVSLLDSPEAVSQLVSRLSDKEVRELLLQQLDAVASEQAVDTTESESLFTLVTTNVPLSVKRALVNFQNIIPAQTASFGMFADKLGPDGVMKLLKGFAFVILLGLVIEFLVRRLMARFRSTIDASSEGFTLAQTLKVLSLRFFLDLSGLIAFMMVTQISIKFFIEEPGQFVMHHVLWNLILIPRLFSAVAKFVFAPKRSDLRLMHASDSSAQFLHRHLVGVVVLVGITLSIFDVQRASGSVHGGAHLGFWFNFIIHCYFGFIAWRSRTIFSEMVNAPGNAPTPLEKRVASAYPYYAVTVVVFSWLLVEVLAAQRMLHLLQQGIQYSTMFILLLAPFLDTVIRALVRHLTPPVVGDGEIAFKAHGSTMRCYVRMGRVMTVMLVLFFLAHIWNLDLANMKTSNIGTDSLVRLFDFIGINAIGYLVWEVVTLLLNMKLASEKTGGAGGGAAAGDEGGVGGSRLSTVLPLVIWFAQTSIVVMTLLISLGSVGIDTTPLLAGAGIVGLAIGFGAQKLVGDIVSGLFFLIDDAFRAGEYVNVEGTVGTVERISLRAMQLRHHRGAIHTIPYGEIPKITNYSRDWTIMKLTFTVPFETDLIKVKKIFKTIGAELLAIPEFADDFIQPFKSQGVIQVDDVGIVVRGKFMVKPGKQFLIRKEIFQRIQKEFERNGIQFARKEVRVKLDQDAPAQLTQAQATTIAAAASEASEIKPAEGT